MTLVAWCLILGLAALWSSAFLFTELILESVGPFTAVALRVGFGALTLLAVAPAIGLPLPRGVRVWAALAVMGALNNAIPFTLITLGQTEITSGMAAILNATTPVFTVIAAHLATADERVTPAKAAGIGFGFAGVVVLIGIEELGRLSAVTVGQILVVGAACSYAAAALWGRRFRAQPATATATGQLVCSSLMMAPVALFAERPDLASMPVGTWAAAFCQGAVVTALAYVLYFAALKRAGSTNLMLVTLLMPPGALLLGWALLAERLSAQDLVGLALILAGLVAIDGRVPRLAGRLSDPRRAR